MIKTLYSVLMVAGLFFSNIATANAQELVGSWAGKLNELRLHFDIKQSGKSYSVSVSSPDNQSITNMAANKVVFKGDQLTFELTDLNGRFEGKLAEGVIDGNWLQLNEKIPLRLTPIAQFVDNFEGPSKQTVDFLLGTWSGVAAFGKTKFNSIVYFRLDDAGKLAVITEFPDNGTHYVALKSARIVDKDIKLELFADKQFFEGRIDGDVIKGNWHFAGFPFVTELKKQEWNMDYFSFELKAPDKKALIGHWYADIPEAGEGTTLGIYFVELANGKVRGYINSADDGWFAIRMDDIKVENGNKLTFAHEGEYTGKFNFDGTLADGKIKGTYKFGDKSAKVEFNQGIAPQVVLKFPAKLNQQLVGQWQGVVDGKPFGLRFERHNEGVVGFIDLLDDGQSAVRVRFGHYKDNKLTLTTAGTSLSYEAKLVDGALVGTLKVADKAYQLKLAKAKQ